MATDLLLPANLTLINGTPFAWQKTLNTSSQMVQWDTIFPDVIEPGQILPLTLQFSNVSSNPEGDGVVVYSFSDGSASEHFDFSLGVSAQQSNPISIDFNNSSAFGNLPQSNFALDWSPDSPAGATFILSGQKDVPSYTPTPVPVDWMHQNLPTIGCQSLRRLCMPGSHDAGMSVLTHGTLFVTEENTLTQWVNIAGQLDAGFRYFDIRPVISAGVFVAGHYSEILDEWVGGNGQDLGSIIDQVNAFTAANNELIILDLSHMYNTDDEWRALNADELNRLISQLQGINHRYSGSTGPNGDLSSLPLNNFIANGPSVVIQLPTSNPPLPPNLPAGIFPSSALNIYNNYADTDNPTQMRNDQLAKLAANRKSRDDPIFLLSWTLTTILDIRALARQAHSLLYEADDAGLWSTVYRNRATSYPNILLIDGIGEASPSPIDNRNVASLSMAINNVVLEGVACPN